MIEFFPSRTVFLSLWQFEIHWYGLMYLSSFLIGLYIAPVLQKYRNIQFSFDQWSNVLVYMVLGVLLGGRLGYVLFYNPLYFISNPLEIFMVWKGGMSSHGGFIGVGIAALLLKRNMQVSLLALLDIVVIPVAIGFALGRIGNFINGELYGAISTVPWALSFPGIEGLRHPTQLYSSISNFIITAALVWHITHVKKPAGSTTALFLILYALQRFCIEFVRIETHSGSSIFGMHFTRGQLFTMPLFIVGVLLLTYLNRKKVSH